MQNSKKNIPFKIEAKIGDNKIILAIQPAKTKVSAYLRALLRFSKYEGFKPETLEVHPPDGTRTIFNEFSQNLN